MKKTFFITFLTLLLSIGWVQKSQSQVLLSLIFGDKLNSGKMEFGLSAGANVSTIRGIEGAKGVNNWELGFYFDIKLKETSPWYVATGVYVKSNVGANGIPIEYPGNRPINDSVYYVFDFFNGTVDKNFNTFYVPINIRYLSKSGIFAEAGAQLGLVFKTTDTYTVEVDGYRLNYEAKEGIFDNEIYSWFDGGINGGLGYKFKKGLGMKVGVWYYVGLTSIYRKDLSLEAYNSSLYIIAHIPIGKKKAEANRKEKESNKQML